MRGLHMTMQPNRGPWVDVHAHPGRCFPGGHSHDRRPARASGGDENGIGSLSDSRFVGLRLRSKRRFRRVVATVEGRTGSNIWTLPMRFEKLRRMKLFAGGIVAMILLSGCFDNNGCSQRRGPEPLIAFLGGKEFSTAPFVKELTTNGDLDCNTQSDGTSVAVRLQGESSRVTAWLLSHRWTIRLCRFFGPLPIRRCWCLTNLWFWTISYRQRKRPVRRPELHAYGSNTGRICLPRPTLPSHSRPARTVLKRAGTTAPNPVRSATTIVKAENVPLSPKPMNWLVDARVGAVRFVVRGL
jgi:hypothetical protein